MDWTLAAAAAALLGYAAISGRVEGTVVTPAIVFVALGLLLGPDALGLLELPGHGHVVRTLAEATLAVVLFSDASRIDVATLRRELTVPTRLLGIGLPLTIVAGAIAAVALFGDLLLGEAVVLAVVLAPTDAALGQAVVTEERLPSRVRQGLNVESGLNDGICVPLLLLALAAADVESSRETTGGAVRLVAEEVGYGVVGGLAAGTAAAAVLLTMGRRGWVAAWWLQVVPVAGAALAYGIAVGLGGSGFIAAFVGGGVFGVLRRRFQGEVEQLLDAVGGVLDSLTFLVFGAALLVPALDVMTPAGVVYIVLSLTVVRMVPVAISLAGSKARLPTVAFLGWFGPRGLASIVFAAIVVEEADLPHTDTIVSVIFVAVAVSVVAHGVSAAPLVRRYVAWYEAHPRRGAGGLGDATATDRR